MNCWRKPEGDLPYRTPGVHVWLAVMPEGWAGAGLLSPEEQSRAAKFVFERDRTQYRYHHTALRIVLAGYTETAPESVPIIACKGGKPGLEAPHANWEFNLSHSGSVAVIAVADRRRIGVDVEMVRPMPDAMEIARRFFSPAEIGSLSSLEGEALERAFFACWTRKEAVLKATGAGLGGDLRSFTVPVDPDASGPWDVAPEWTIASLPPTAGHAGALAVQGAPVAVQHWKLAYSSDRQG